MSATIAIAIFAGSHAQEAYLADIVRLAGYAPETGGRAAAVTLVAKSGYNPGQNETIFDLVGAKAPLRAADIIEMLRSSVTSQTAAPEEIPIGDAVLNTVENLWQRAGETAVRLTEKESAILLCLHDTGGKALGRDALLHSVWAYAADAETHTLETHIYRLRQKIERDPAAPAILLTDGDGYKLAF